MTSPGEDHGLQPHGYVSPVAAPPSRSTHGSRYEALAVALKLTFAKQEPDPCTRSHEQFQNEVDEYDRNSESGKASVKLEYRFFVLDQSFGLSN